MMENKNIVLFKNLIKPNELKDVFPLTKTIERHVIACRQEVEDIINKKSSKKLVIVGPCSIHNVSEALEYGKKLKLISDKVKDKFFIVMRVYFEKPRTTVGWKGLINDPDLNNTFDVNKGLRLARKLLIDLNNIGLPCGCEILDTITPQYISDLISWGAIGARTTESQVHRQLVSGLSMPIGFKNGTDGDIGIAADAIVSAKYPHCFMGISDDGIPSICQTNGNETCHIILRGGKHGPNYFKEDIVKTEDVLKSKELNPSIIVDCSHGNSNKDFRNQPGVLEYLSKKVMSEVDYSNTVIGFMLESNLVEGKQKLDFNNPGELEYGISITDSCLSIEETDTILLKAYNTI